MININIVCEREKERECVCDRESSLTHTPCLSIRKRGFGMLLRKFLFVVMFYRREREKKSGTEITSIFKTAMGKIVFDRIFFVNIMFFLLPS